MFVRALTNAKLQLSLDTKVMSLVSESTTITLENVSQSKLEKSSSQTFLINQTTPLLPQGKFAVRQLIEAVTAVFSFNSS